MGVIDIYLRSNGGLELVKGIPSNIYSIRLQTRLIVELIFSARIARVEPRWSETIWGVAHTTHLVERLRWSRRISEYMYDHAVVV